MDQIDVLQLFVLRMVPRRYNCLLGITYMKPYNDYLHETAYKWMTILKQKYLVEAIWLLVLDKNT